MSEPIPAEILEASLVRFRLEAQQFLHSDDLWLRSRMALKMIMVPAMWIRPQHFQAHLQVPPDSRNPDGVALRLIKVIYPNGNLTAVLKYKRVDVIVDPQGVLRVKP